MLLTLVCAGVGKGEGVVSDGGSVPDMSFARLLTGDAGDKSADAVASTAASFASLTRILPSAVGAPHLCGTAALALKLSLPLVAASASASPMWAQRMWALVGAPVARAAASATSVAMAGDSGAVVCALLAGLDSSSLTDETLVAECARCVAMTVSVHEPGAMAGGTVDTAAGGWRVSVALAALSTLLASTDWRVHVLADVRSLTLALVHLACLCPSASERAQALKCLILIAKADLPYSRLHPLKLPLMKSLKGPVDDPKRVVRLLAARTRNAWAVLE